ncbi:MAG: phage portal protein [Ruminococcus sp.]|nr:phage portal protein [Ruminococcus sp.]
MNILKRLSLAWRIIRKKSSNEVVALNDLFSFLGIDPKTEKRPISEATYFACMKVLSESLGKLPLKIHLYNEKNGVETVRDHELYYTLHDRPNPYMTSSVFWSSMEYNRNHYGNAYAWIQRLPNRTYLWILPPNEVEVWLDDAKILADQIDVFYKYSANGKQYIFKSDEILHFKASVTADGLLGKPVRQRLKETITGGIKSQKMLNKLYDSGFTAKAVLQYTGSLNDENVKAFVAGIESYAKGDLSSEGIENIIPIPIGAELTPLNVKLTDSQFIEIRQYTALQIASAFGIKPYQIGDYTKSSYASAEAQQLSFYVDTLLYILKQYEEELTFKLLDDEEIKKGYRAKFNVAAILRADLATQIDTITKGIAGFLYTPNEGRAMLDLESVPGGDTLIGNGATIPIGMVGTQYIKDDDPKNNEGGG